MAITEATLAEVERIRKQVASMTADQTLALTRAWVAAWDVLQPELNAAISELLANAKDGRVPVTVVAKNKRLLAALRQARAMLEELAKQTNTQVITDVGQAMADAVSQHEAMIRTQLPPGTAGAAITFTRVDSAALAAIVERTTQRIHSLTYHLGADAERIMKAQLIRGITVGANPRKTAARIIRLTEQGFNGGLTRALNIARTETLDAHRAATQASEKANSSVLEGWEWSANLSARTCPSCLAMHGTRHPLNEPGPQDHPSGRCARITVTKSWKDLGIDLEEPEPLTQDSESWFNNLTDSSKIEVLGKTRTEMLANGDIKWADLSVKRGNKGWRDSYSMRTIAELRAISH